MLEKLYWHTCLQIYVLQQHSVFHSVPKRFVSSIYISFSFDKYSNKVIIVKNNLSSWIIDILTNNYNNYLCADTNKINQQMYCNQK